MGSISKSDPNGSSVEHRLPQRIRPSGAKDRIAILMTKERRPAIRTRPSIVDIEATASTLCLARAWKKPFAFVLNQAPIRGQRVDNAADTIAEEAELDLAEVLARPLIAMRNDHQDALSAGLAASEYAPTSKSAEEIRRLWQWVEARLPADVSASELTRSLGILLPKQEGPAAFVF